MRIEFLKMQGLGNDFLVFDAAAVAAHTHLDEWTLRALADRHTGVGFDQALMLERRAIRQAGCSTEYSIPTAPKSNSAAMARAVSRRCCMRVPRSWAAISSWAAAASGCVRASGMTDWCRWTWAYRCLTRRSPFR